MANSGFSPQLRQRPSKNRRRTLRFELLDQRRVLASLAGQISVEFGPESVLAGDATASNQIAVAEQSTSKSASSSVSIWRAGPQVTAASPSAVVPALLSTAPEGEVVATSGNSAYARLGRELTQIDLATGTVTSIELPGDVLAVQLLSDGRVLAMLEVAAGGDGQATGPAAVLVSFASGQWTAVERNAGEQGDAEQGAAEDGPAAEADARGAAQWASVALARGDRGLWLAASSNDRLQVHGLSVDPTDLQLRSQPLPFEVAAGSRLFASPSGPLAVISEPTDGGQRLSLWSTRADAPVAGSELVVGGLDQVLSFDDASGLVVARETTGGIRLLDAANHFATLQRLPEWTGPVAFDAARERLYGLLDGLTLNIFDVRENRSVASLPLDPAAAAVVGGIALADAGNRLALSSSAGISQIDLGRIEALRTRLQADAPTVDQMFQAYADAPLESVAGEGEGASEPPRIEPGEVTMPENEVGAVVTTLQISGIDEDKQGEFGVFDPRFVIDGSQLRLADGISLDYELEPIVQVGVTMPVGDAVLRQTITITVVDTPDPISNIGVDAYTLPERTPGHVLGPIRVMDQDSSEFDISVDDDRFEIIDGQLKLRTGVFVRRADQSEILLTVTADATDDPLPSFSKELILLVLANEAHWHNEDNPTDVDRDGDTDPTDVLLVINRLNGSGPGDLGEPVPYEGDEVYMYDVNGDGWVTPIDALIIINELNRGSDGLAEQDGAPPILAGGEGEGSLPLRTKSAVPATAAPQIADTEPASSTPLQASAGAAFAADASLHDLLGEEAEEVDEPRDEYFSGLGLNLS